MIAPSSMQFLAVTVMGLMASVRTLAAQGGPPRPPAEVSVAQAALQAGLADSAIRTLEGFFARNPNATAGRLLLGNAFVQKGDTDKAIAAYQQITAPRPMRLQATFLTAALHARRGRSDEALKLLEQLKASGAYDMDLARTAADFAPIRSDPRFASVMFAPADFANPFVEPVRVIHEWRGEAKGDQFSWIARGIGDVDGDKVSDVVTSAPTFGANGQPTGPGKVYVYSGRSGKLLWERVGQVGEGLGTGLEGAGDVNRDGVPDVIAGAPGSGHAYVYSGRDGKTLLTLTGTAQESYGNSAAGAGDQNGDGYADVIVGAPSSNANGEGAGRAYVVSGKDGAVIATLGGQQAGDAFGSIVAGNKRGRGTPVLVGAPGGGPNDRGSVSVFTRLTSPPTRVIAADSTGAALGGMFTSLVGDVNGDKVADVYASDFSNSAKGAATGRVYVYSGADGRRLYTLTGENAGDGFGIGSADVGDVNRDGFDDLLVGAWQYSAAAQSGGKIYLYSGRDGSLLRQITGRVPGETLGFDATGVGDVDGDGVIDLLVTSSWSNINGFRSGRMFVISGK
ncbi:MAG TPA: FG-GAP-like repeat-containing protein [Gemmatimonadaceae bacterium]|nr:FG-GAP-like repeat-containing protein [Gemmatimonadaceae bacterium]